MMKMILSFFLLAILGGDIVAMESEPVKLTLWRRIETIGGEEFLAANEGVIDYIATLPRPTQPMTGLRYNCAAKMRYIRPTVRQFSATGASQWVDVRMVYELKDCTEIK